MKKLLTIFIALILILPITSAYYGGYLGGDAEQEYTTYTVSKNSPYESYDKTYTKTSYQTPGGEVTTKSYTILDQDSGWGSYPSTTYKTYTSTKTSGLGYAPYTNNYYKQPQIKTVYITPTNNRYQDRSCSYWRCQPDYAPQYYKYSNNYLDDYYYSPHYDSNLGYYNWRW